MTRYYCVCSPGKTMLTIHPPTKSKLERNYNRNKSNELLRLNSIFWTKAITNDYEKCTL